MTARRTPRGQRWTIPQHTRCPRVHRTLLWLRLLWVRGTWRGKYRKTLNWVLFPLFSCGAVYRKTITWKNRLYYHYYQWESFRVLFFLCKLGLLLFYLHWDYQRTENEMSSGLSSKKTPSFKWPFPFSFLKIHGQHRSSDPCTMQTKLGSLRSNVFNGLPLPWSIRTTDEWIPTPEDYF